jgi:hypothetical protein
MIGLFEARKILRQNRKKIPDNIYLISTIITVVTFFLLSKFIFFEWAEYLFPTSFLYQLFFVAILAFIIFFPYVYIWSIALIKIYRLNLQIE